MRSLIKTTLLLPLFFCSSLLAGDGLWTPAPVAVMPEGVASFGAAIEGDWLYTYGGHSGRPHSHSIENLSPNFRRLNLKDLKTWEELPRRTATQASPLVASQGKLYRVGGLTAKNKTTKEKEILHSLSEVEIFDVKKLTWTEATPLPDHRSSHDVVILDGVLYVMGGWTLSENEKSAWLDTAWKADLSQDPLEWKPIASPKFKRRAVALSVHQNKIVLIGGLTDEGDMTSRTQIYDPKSDTWSEGPKYPGMGFGLSAFEVKGQALVSGMDGQILQLQKDSKDWVSVGEQLFPRFFHRLVTKGDDEVYWIGGAAASGHVRQIERIHLSQQIQKGVVSHVRLPYPGAARGRQSQWVRGDELILVGGNNDQDAHAFKPKNFLKESYRVSLGTLKVREHFAFPEARQSAVMILPNESGKNKVRRVMRRPSRNEALYVLGGFGHDGKIARSWGDLYKYGFRNRKWEKLNLQLPESRTQFGVAYFEKALWVFGGLDYAPRESRDKSFHLVKDIVKINLSGAEPTVEKTSSKLKQSRRAFAGALLNDRYYLVGGMKEHFKFVDQCEYFDLKKKEWGSIPSPGKARLSAQLIPIENKLYLVGGYSKDSDGKIVPNRSIESFDPQNGSWALEEAKLPLESYEVQAHYYRNHLLIASTFQGDQPTLELILWSPGKSTLVETKTTVQSF